MNFQSIMALEDQCTPHHLKKVLKNGWFWLNSTISCAGTVQRCCTIGQTKNFKILQFFFFFKDIHKLWKIFFSNFWWIFRPIMVLDPKHGPKKSWFLHKNDKKLWKKFFWPPPYRYVADMLEVVHSCQKVCHNILCHILKVVWWYLTLVLPQTSKSTIFFGHFGWFWPPPLSEILQF